MWLNGIREVAKCGSGGTVVVPSFDDYRVGGPKDIESIRWDKVYPDDGVSTS